MNFMDSDILKHTSTIRSEIFGTLVVAPLLENLTSYENACTILGEDPVSSDINIKILKIVKAANFITNGCKTWVPDFENSSQLKYYVYFQKVSGSWRVIGAFCDVAIVGSGFYFENKETCLIIVKRFISLYSEWLDQ